MNKISLKPVWAGHNMRLDPKRLPHTVSYATRDDNADVTFSISQRGAVINRVLQKSGLPISIALPARAFVGVAARAIDDGLGEVTVTLELLHQDPSLSAPLLVASNLDDVAADWRAWAAFYGLPMLVIEADGVARPVDEASDDNARFAAAAPRRQRKLSRARFHAYRKQGGLGCRLVVDGQEVIG